MEHLAKLYYYENNFGQIISKYPNSAHKLFRILLHLAILCCNAVSQRRSKNKRRKKNR